MNQPDAIYDSSPRDVPAQGHLRKATFGALIHGWLEAGLKLLFPPRCAGCQRVDTCWCVRCQSLLEEIPFPAPQTFAAGPVAVLAASGVHAGLLRQALLALKYEHTPQLAGPLGTRLARLVRRQAWPVELLVPVPLHPSRERERGYNQAQLLGLALAEQHGIRQCPAALRRVVATRAQVGLDQQERRHNVQGAFVAERKLVQKRAVLLVDDVYTTGATMHASAQALHDAGARTVYGLTLTRAGSPDAHNGGAKRWM